MTVVMTMRMSMAVVVSRMSMVPKASHSHQIDSQAEGADDEQFSQSLGFSSLGKSLRGLNDDLNADKPIGS